MPQIIQKYPSSKPNIIHVDARSVSELCEEKRMILLPVNLGGGLMLLVQSNTEYDNPNFIFENMGISGSVFVVRFTKDKLIDVREDDLEKFLDQITIIEEEY